MAIPEGTKAWRKSWRRKWREESSFRDLSPLSKLLVGWVEDNADDDGSVTSTVRYLSAMLGGKHKRHKIPRMTLWRALKEAERVGLIVTEAGQLAGQDWGQQPTKITRVNFRVYQVDANTSGTTSGTDMALEAGRSSRSIRGAEKTSPVTQALPGLEAPALEPQPGPVAGKRKRKAKGSVEGHAPDPRHREFVSIFARVFRDHREAPPAFARGDFAALKRWLHDQPQLTAEEFEFKCREAHRSTGFKNACSLQKLCTSEVWNQLTPYAPVRLGPVRETNREWKSPEEWGIPDEQSAEAVAMGEVGTLGEPPVRSAAVAVAGPSTARREAGDTLSLPACPEW